MGEETKRPIIQIPIGSIIDKLEITIPDDLQPEERERLLKLCSDLKDSVKEKAVQSISNMLELQ